MKRIIEKDREFNLKVVVPANQQSVDEERALSKAEAVFAVSKKPGGEAFYIDSSRPQTPPRENKSTVVLDKSLDLRESLKGDPIHRYMSLDAQEYKQYKGRDNGLVIDEPPKQLSNQELMENAFNHYMAGRRPPYDGKFDPQEADGDNGYDRYKKLFDIPEDAKNYEKFRKEAEGDKVRENKGKLWKPEEPVALVPVPYIGYEKLRPLSDPEKFIVDFPDDTESSLR